jgi:molecular chaperone Hsp33
MLVADFSTTGSLRAYARFDAERVAAVSDAAVLMGKGILALTIDQGEFTQRYQGIVELDGVSLEEAARRYFKQSEQIPTDIRLAVAKQRKPGEAGEHWRAGGVLAQFLPDAPERMRSPDLHGGDLDARVAQDHRADDAWEELLALMATIEPAELIDPMIGAERLLYRLFHEHGVRVFETAAVDERCSCSRDRIRGVLEGFSAEEIRDSVEEGSIRVACEFCSTEYVFDPAEFSKSD